jgi:hypothetical protein
MDDYAAYGLTIRCDLPLPELLKASAFENAPAPWARGAGHVRIQLAAFDRSAPPQFAKDADVWATADCAFLDYPGVAAYLIRGGREILIDVVPDAEMRLVRLFLLGPALALLLHQRNFLVLHASAVMIGGQAIAFVGEKGMGKSTMAAALHSAGYPLVADDLVAVDTSGAVPLAYPGFPQLKLFPESAALLEADPKKLPKIHPDLDKRARKATQGFPTRALELRRVFVLEDAAAEGVELLPAREAFMQLVGHSYLLGFLRATNSVAAHFKQAVALAGAVPIMKLRRRRCLDALDAVVKTLEGELQRAA